MQESVHVQAPSRLHFGLMNFGGSDARQFGGVGMMVDRPGLSLTIARTERFAAAGPMDERIREFAERWRAFHRLEKLPSCTVTVQLAPRQHTGLGVGTQLGMSVAAGLSRWVGLPDQSPLELASSVGRTRRSAVGVYGFMLGGLIAERGKYPGESLSPLDCHLQLSESWRVLLITPRDAVGLASDEESHAFARLPPVAETVTKELTRIAREQLLPAAARGDFDVFANAVYEYGKLSGQCFAAVQGGVYNGPRLQALVNLLRSLDVTGVGQSSWGPTIFAIFPHEHAAAHVADLLASRQETGDSEMLITGVSQHGARVQSTPARA